MSYRGYIEKIALVIIVIVISTYIWIVYRYTSDMPISDDYGAVLLFLNLYTQSDGLLDKFYMVFNQHNEHRIVFNRIIEILQWKITGEVNFLYLTIIGNIGWLLCVYILWYYSYKRHIVTVSTFLPVALLMFSFSHAALTTWAMASLQNYWQIIFSLAAIYLITQHRLVWALIVMTFALFTGGAGIALIPVITLYLLATKQWKQVFITVVWVILILLIYFVLIKYYPKGVEKNYISIVFIHYDRFLSYIFTFLGNIAETENYSKILGMVSVGLFLSSISTTLKKEPFIAYALIFVFTIAVLAGIARSSAGVEQAMSSRYGIYSVLFISLVYLQYLSRYKNNAKIIVIGYIVGLCTFGYYLTNIPAFEKRKYLAETSLYHPSYQLAEKRLYTSRELRTFYSWDELKLPSSLLHITKKEGDNHFNINIVNKPFISTMLDINKTLKILPSNSSLSIKGWVGELDESKKPCGVIVEYQKRKQIIYCKDDDMNLCYIDDDINIVTADYASSLYVRTIAHDCKNYYESLKINIDIIGVEELIALPIVNKELKGWIDTFSVMNETLRVKGWYAQKDAPVLSKTLLLEIDNEIFVSHYGYQRPDVASYLDNDAYRYSGFQLKLEKNKIGFGKHKVQVYILSDDLKTLYRDTKKYEFIIK